MTFYGKETSLEAAWKYAIIGGVGLSMALFGTVLTYYAGHQCLGTESLAGLNWSVLASTPGSSIRPRCGWRSSWCCSATEPKPDSRRCTRGSPMRTARRPCPSAAILSSAMLNCALYGLVRFYILTSRCLGPEFPAACCCCLESPPWESRCRFILLQGTSAGCSHIPASIRRESW